MCRNRPKHADMPRPFWLVRGLVLLITILLLAGCSSKRPLMSTPDVYALGIEQPFSESLPQQLRTVDVNILYATDRIPQPRQDGRLDYGTGRAPTLAFGEAVVSMGGDTSWEELARDARSGVRSPALYLDVKDVTEKAEGPRGSVIYWGREGRIEATGEGAREFELYTSTIREQILAQLETSPRNEILLFVHGVRTSFDEALYITAELWHYLGREFVPIAYSWPAGKKRLLKGYIYDRESSEFTVFHFKHLVKWIATLPEVEGIHIIAHSRGTDVVTTAVRELNIEARAGGHDPLQRYKLRNVVIAAPDINIDIFMQRTEREGMRWAAHRWTTYTSSRDRAIGSSEWLFSGGRMGKTHYDSLDDYAKLWVEAFGQPEAAERDSVIQYLGRKGGAFGHNYFRTNPSVASDLVLTIRYGRSPGAENGRPLEHVEGMFWKIDDDYLKSPDEK